MFINKIKTAAILVVMFLSLGMFSQGSYGKLLKDFRSISNSDSVSGFDYNFHKAVALNGGFVGTEFNVYMYQQMRAFVNRKYKLSNQNGTNLRPPSGGNQINAAPCVNEDFEATAPVPFTTIPQGGAPYTTLSGWNVTSGQNGNFFNNIYYTTCSVSVMPNAYFNQPVTECWVRSTPIADPNFPGGVPNSPLGGTRVLQLNDNLALSGQITRVSQTFPVTSSNALFQYAYAACFNGTGHACCDQPFLNIKLRDCNNNPITCPQVTVIASGPSCTTGTGGFLTNISGYLYKNWTVQSIDLTPYIGSCVTIEVAVGDCTGWAHFGYCYFDAVCKPITLQVNNNLFPAGSNAVVAAGCGTNTAVMTAPPGLGPYTWQGPPGSGINNNPNQTITTSFAGTYTLTMNPVGSCTPSIKTVSLTFGQNPNGGFTKTNLCNTYTFTNTGSASPAVQTYSFIGVNPPASYTTTSPTSSVIFPNPGTYTIQQVVTNTIGCTATTTQVVNVVGGPTLTVSNSQICPGLSATLSVSGANTYTWTGSNLSNPNSLNPVATPSATSIYTVVGTNTTTGCKGTNTLQVTILPTPTLTVNSLTMCAGSSSVLTVSGGSTYTWSPSLGLSSPNVANPTANPTVTTIYTVVTTATNGCQSSTTSTVGVSALPVLSVTSPSTCAGILTTVTVSGANTYSWSTGATTSTISVNPIVATIYTVVGTSSVGCKSTSTTQVSILPPLQVQILTNSPICQNSNLTFTSNISGASYVWSGPNGYTTNIQNPQITVAQPSVSGTYSIFVTNTQGCVGSASAAVVVNPLPNPVATNNSPICQGNTLTFLGNGGTIYNWSGPSWSSNQQNPNIAQSFTTNSGVYTLTVTDANGCQNITTTSVVVNPLPNPTASSSTVCSGATASLSATGGITYLWQGPNFTSNLQNPTLPNANTSMSGIYSLTVTNQFGCVGFANVNLIVSPPFTVSCSNDSPKCEGSAINFTATPGFVYYSWQGPGFLTNGQYPQINPATVESTGFYTLTVANSLGCLGTAQTFVQINSNPKLQITHSADKICTPELFK